MYVNHSQSNNQVNKFDNQGCQASLGKDGKCGEVRTLEILKEFHQLYENKINQIEDNCNCKSCQTKVDMLNDWVKDLTEQNTLLVQVVEELEHEASERVCLLEERLRHSSKTSYEIMKTLQEYDAHNLSNQSDVLQRIMYFQSDINNLIEFVKRIRDEGTWSTEGLNFYFVSQEDLTADVPSSAKSLSKQREMEDAITKLKLELSKSKQRQDTYEKESKERESVIREQSEQIDKLNNVVDQCASCMPDKQKLVEELHELRAQLKLKSDQFTRLEKSVTDMREALTAEVADKHDNIMSLRRECQMLEERCRQSDKQTHFKDDIIKEMRKELKQLRAKLEVDELTENDELKAQIDALEQENKGLRKTINEAYEEITTLRDQIEKYNREQHETITQLRAKIIRRGSTEKIMMLRKSEREDSATTGNAEKLQMSLFPAPDILQTLQVLKCDINKLINLKDNHELNEIKKQFEEVEIALQELENKDKLIKNKDEMIKIQTDTLNVSQKELKELRSKIADFEDEKDNRVQELLNLQQALKLNQNTIEELEKALGNSEEKAHNMQQAADLYMETISLLESAKLKAEMEVEQQRITIGNLQDALVSTKQQLEGVQGRGAAEIKEKTDVIYALYQELAEMQSQYIDCYGEIVKLSQTADCLRDSNLSLKEVNINLKQDIDELNEKILNYRENIRALEENLQRVLEANDILESDIVFMKKEMADLAIELQSLQKLLKITNLASTEDRNSSLTKSLQILQEHSESLVEQLKITQKQVTREIKLNETSSFKIEELQTQLNTKTSELQRYESDLALTNNKLDESIHKAKLYENKIKTMEKQITEFKEQQLNTETKSNELMRTYNTDLIDLNNKVEILNKLLNEKSDEILKLHAELSIKSDENEVLKRNSIEEIQRLTHQTTTLEEQLSAVRSHYSEMNEKYKKSKSELESIKKWEQTLQEEYKREKKMLSEKYEISQNEEIRLNNIITDLKNELERVKECLKQKDDDLKEFGVAQEEIIALKEEINHVTRIRNRILCDNQKLQETISKLNINSSQFESRNKVISQQLDKCLQELNILQCAKEKLEDRNAQLETEIEQFQRTFNELNQEIRYKNESVVNLEQELTEAKCSRDEICAESRIVVGNVRSWLEEQKRINSVLNNTVKEKNGVIEELSLERNLLLKNIKEVCTRYSELSKELQSCKQYLMSLNEDQNKFRTSPSSLKKSIYTWGSQGSVSCDSPISSPVFVEEQGFEYNITYDDSENETNPALWMHKVQSMNKDLQKSNKYWKSKMGNSKKIKPVKDCNNTS